MPNDHPVLESLAPNTDWTSLPIFVRAGCKRVKFGDVVKLSKDSVKDPKEAGVERYIAMEHLEPGSLHIRDWGNVADGTTFRKLCAPGQVLFGKRRAYQRKVAVADFEAVVSGDIYVLASKDENVLLPELLPFLCLAEPSFEHAVGTSAGSLSPRTNWDQLTTFEFDLAPLDQQRRIAEILWAADDKLTSSKSLVNAITMAIAAKVVGAFFDSEKQTRFTSKWPTKRLEEIVEADAPIRYGIVQVLKDVEGGVPTLAINSLTGDFINGIHRTAPEIEEGYIGSRVKPGDVLIAVKGATAGKVGIVPNHFSGNISRDLARIRCGPSIHPRLLLQLMRSRPYQLYINRYAVGSTRKELSIHNLRRFEIPIPPRSSAEQLLLELDQLDQALLEAKNNVSTTSNLLSSLINSFS